MSVCIHNACAMRVYTMYTCTMCLCVCVRERERNRHIHYLHLKHTHLYVGIHTNKYSYTHIPGVIGLQSKGLEVTMQCRMYMCQSHALLYLQVQFLEHQLLNA